jgi:hypothetical protein
MNEGPFESRVFVIPRVQWPGSIEICGYCTAAQMTVDLVAQIVTQTERATEEQVSHTLRKTFPQPLQASIQEEVVWAWKSRNRILTLMTKLSGPNRVSISASSHPFKSGYRYPADWGEFRILIGRAAPGASTVIEKLQKYAELSGAFFARAESPAWWESYNSLKGTADEIALPSLRVASEPGWALGLTLGWINYFGPRAATELGLDAAARTADVHKLEVMPNGGRLLSITAEPLDFRDEAHRRRYNGLLRELASHEIKQ